jgi:hypothetical protein
MLNWTVAKARQSCGLKHGYGIVARKDLGEYADLHHRSPDTSARRTERRVRTDSAMASIALTHATPSSMLAPVIGVPSRIVDTADVTATRPSPQGISRQTYEVGGQGHVGRVDPLSSACGAVVLRLCLQDPNDEEGEAFLSIESLTRGVEILLAQGVALALRHHRFGLLVCGERRTEIRASSGRLAQGHRQRPAERERGG